MPFDARPPSPPSPLPLSRLRRLAYRVFYSEGQRCRDIEDLIQEGALAVLEARRLQVDFTASQINYEMRVAYLRMLAFVRRWIGISPKRARNVAAMYAARRHLAITMGREPSESEIAAHLRWSMRRLWDAMLDAANADGGKEAYAEMIKDDPDLEEQAIEFETEQQWRRALASLSEHHGWIWRERSAGRTQLELAKSAGCGRTKIQREEQEMITTLRQAMGVSCAS